MSKSKGNGTAPHEMSSLYGVDSLRAAILFGAPPEKDLNFDKQTIASIHSYLSKVVRLSAIEVTKNAESSFE